MGDIWPYGAPDYLPWQSVYNQLLASGANATTANILAAIGMAESSEDVTVINDTPATGDYSVGVFQINYYGSLYDSRAAEFGTPQQLIQGGIAAQCRAALAIAAGGFTPWSTYNSGAYIQYLNDAIPGAPAGSGSGGTAEPEIEDGSTGAAVQLLQQDLNLLGAGLAVDGDFGPLTLAAVENFQRSAGLTVDGIVGPLTWAALETAVASLEGIAAGAGAAVAPPPAPEAPPGVDPDTAAAWSNLAYQTGPVINSLLATMGTLTSTSPVG